MSQYLQRILTTDQLCKIAFCKQLGKTWSAARVLSILTYTSLCHRGSLHISRDSIKPDFEMDANDSNRLDVDDEMHDGRYLCDWCPAKFENRSAARIHESTHRGQEPKCYVCSKRYADRYSLRYHHRTHGIGRQIRCEHCNKAFSKPSRLAAHVRSHHKNIRDFACPSCDKAFKTRVHLTNHYRQHSGGK